MSDTLANPKNRGLGRGLNALFEDDEAFAGIGDGAASSSLASGRVSVGIELPQQSQIQPRKIFEETALQELADSIKTHGLLQPIIVRPSANDDGHYEIIAGERRWRAAQRAQLHEVSVIVLELSDVEALEIALVENLQREDLNAVDEAMGYQRLMNEYSYTQEQLAESLGKSRPHVANMVRLLNLPDVVLAFLERGDLTAGHARALVTAADPESLAREIVSGGLSVRQTEQMVAQANGKSVKSKAKAKYKKDVDTIALEKDISDRLGMRVLIDSKNGKSGKVSIAFKSLDQLDDVLKRF